MLLKLLEGMLKLLRRHAWSRLNLAVRLPKSLRQGSRSLDGDNVQALSLYRRRIALY
jgi:hypothetical protein